MRAHGSPSQADVSCSGPGLHRYQNLQNAPVQQSSGLTAAFCLVWQSRYFLCRMRGLVDSGLWNAGLLSEVEDCSRAKLTACKHPCRKTPKARVLAKLLMWLLPEAVRRFCGAAGRGGLEFLAAGSTLSNLRRSFEPVYGTRMLNSASGHLQGQHGHGLEGRTHPLRDAGFDQ